MWVAFYQYTVGEQNISAANALLPQHIFLFSYYRPCLFIIFLWICVQNRRKQSIPYSYVLRGWEFLRGMRAIYHATVRSRSQIMIFFSMILYSFLLLFYLFSVNRVLTVTKKVKNERRGRKNEQSRSKIALQTNTKSMKNDDGTLGQKQEGKGVFLGVVLTVISPTRTHPDSTPQRFGVVVVVVVVLGAHSYSLGVVFLSASSSQTKETALALHRWKRLICWEVDRQWSIR